MGIVHIKKRGEDLSEYRRALKMAKKGIEMLCDLTDEMEDRYSYDEDDDYEEDEKSYRRRK